MGAMIVTPMGARHAPAPFARLRASCVALAVAALTALACSPDAFATQETASLGNVSAVFSYTKGTATKPYTGLTLTITRAGQVGFRGPVAMTACQDPDCTCEEPDCYPSLDGHTVHVVDLARDGEPEVLLDLHTGGAHCCAITRFFVWNGSGYEVVEHNFADPGYRRADLDGDHVVELVSADPRFAYLFTSYAESLPPIQIWHLGTGELIDVTDTFRDRIRRDARSAYSIYRRSRSRGAIAAWAADRYRLGHRTSTLRRLRRLARAHRLPARGFSPKGQRRFVVKLDRYLRQFGYG